MKILDDMDQVATDLHRLRAVNQELLTALKDLLPILDKAWAFDGDVFGCLHNDAVDADMNARAVIARSTGKD